MQMVKKSIMVFVLAWISLLWLMPKPEMYYSLEKILATQEVALNEKSIDEGIFSLEIRDVTVYVKGIALAHIDHINFFTILFFNTIEIDKLLIDEALQNKIPALTQKAILTYHLFSPMSISLDANGSYGKAMGIVSLDEQKIHIDFNDTKKIETIKPFLRKGKKGWFYEKSF